MTDHQENNHGSSRPDDDLQEEVVRIIARTDRNGHAFARMTLTPASDTRRKEVLCDVRPIIPVIFLPGVMGSLLADKDTGGELFFAPNTDGALQSVLALADLIRMWFQSAESRQKSFDPTRAVVTPLGPINVGKHVLGVDEEEARRRGWGSVHRTSYHPVLAWLEEELNQPMFLGQPHGAWVNPDPEGEKWALKPVLGTAPAEYGGIGNGETITLDSQAFKHFAKYQYRVYAIGYNWLQSNADSARQVIDGSDFYDPTSKKTMRLMGIKEICAENDTGKAIIVTHSMGGLVARMAIAMHGAADLMHGVFHNVQPATGAPVTAKRFRTGGGSEGGFNGFVNGALVGRKAPEFVAVAANAPGPLELLPMPDYNNGKPWWVFAQLNGEPVIELPKKPGKALEEIYTNSAWYGLVPNEKLLDPAGLVKEKLDINPMRKTVLQNFHQTMKSVAVKQSEIQNLYHRVTYASYGNGALKEQPRTSATIDVVGRHKPLLERGQKLEKLLTWGKVIWRGVLPSSVTEAELRSATALSDSESGNVRVHLESHKQTVEFEVKKVAILPFGVSDPDPSRRENSYGIVAGDGTVPVWSAQAQARGLDPKVKGDTATGVRMAFAQGGYGHQESYDHPWTRWALLYSIVKIAQDARELSC